MKKDQNEEGRMTEHSRGLGTVTRDMVVKRARELAMINGRSPDSILQSDFEEAHRELTGGGDLAENDPRNLDRRSEADLRETVRGSRGRQAPKVPAHDEQTDAEKLVEEGVSEAEHDQMVEGTRESLRRGMD